MVEREKALKKIGNFVIFDGIIDQNQTGTLYRAQSEKTKDPFVIRISTKERIKSDSTFLDKIKFEEKFLKDLQNPNLLKYNMTIETNNYFYFVVESTEEGHLESYLSKKKTMNEDEICQVFVQLLNGYQEFHTKGIIHKNISSKSIYKSNNYYKLIPFYIADYYDSIENSYKVNRPPSFYASTETLESIIDPKADIWSMGVLLYELAFGKVPFEGSNAIILSKVIDKTSSEIIKNIDNNNNLSKDLKSLIKRMLEPSEKRIDFINIIKHPFIQSLKLILQNEINKNYDNVLNEIRNGKIKAFNNKDNLLKLPDSYKFIWNAENLALLEKIDHFLGFQVKLIQIIFNLEKSFCNIDHLALFSIDRKLMNSQSVDYIKKPMKNQFKLDESSNFSNNYLDENVPKVRMPKSKVNNISEKRNEINFDTSESIKNSSNSLSKELQNSSGSIKEDKKIDTLSLIKPTQMPNIIHEKQNSKSILQDNKLSKAPLASILEISGEESMRLPNFESVIIKYKFEESINQLFTYYLHEKEIIEFLYQVILDCNNCKIPSEVAFCNFANCKLLYLRFNFLKSNLNFKENNFNLPFWNEITNSDIFNQVKNKIVDKEKEYYNLYEKHFNKAKLLKNDLKIQNEYSCFIDFDTNTPHHIFVKGYNYFIICFINEIMNLVKSIEKNKIKQIKEVLELAYKLIFCIEIQKNLSFIKVDINSICNVNEFLEKLNNYEVEKLKKEIDSYLIDINK